jgi:uncharacterized protein (TIGR00369 family)
MIKARTPREVAPDLLERLRARFGGFPLIRDWNMCIQAVEPGLGRVTMVPSVNTTNTSGVVNGGVLATLADMTSALALSTHFDGKMPFATSDLHIRYLEPAQGELTVEATVVRASLRSAILECRILCGERVVALCTAHFTIKLRSRETP